MKHEEIKNLALFIFSGLAGIVSNFDYALIALFAGFTLNFIIGLSADVRQGRNFNIRKATDGIKLLMFYMVTIFCLYAMTYKDPSLANVVIRWLTMIVSYFYTTNIFRNAKVIFPENRSVYFIYMFLSTEVFLRLKDYIGIKHQESKDKKSKKK